MSLDDLWTAKDVARHTQVDLRTFYRWCRAGIGPRPIRLGGAIRYRAGDIADWLEHTARATRHRRAEE
jgi:predicted DNA-binding transcriptional regulator AlpA